MDPPPAAADDGDGEVVIHDAVVGDASGESPMFGRGRPGRPLLIYGDASGGPESASAVLRRVAWAVAVVDHAALAGTRVEAWAAAPMLGRRQTVHRGELLAVLVALRYTRRDVVYVGDNRAVVAGWHARTFCRPSGPDADLWRRVALARAARGPGVFTVRG